MTGCLAQIAFCDQQITTIDRQLAQFAVSSHGCASKIRDAELAAGAPRLPKRYTGQRVRDPSAPMGGG